MKVIVLNFLTLENVTTFTLFATFFDTVLLASLSSVSFLNIAIEMIAGVVLESSTVSGRIVSEAISSDESISEHIASIDIADEDITSRYKVSNDSASKEITGKGPGVYVSPRTTSSVINGLTRSGRGPTESEFIDTGAIELGVSDLYAIGQGSGVSGASEVGVIE